MIDYLKFSLSLRSEKILPKSTRSRIFGEPKIFEICKMQKFSEPGCFTFYFQFADPKNKTQKYFDPCANIPSTPKAPKISLYMQTYAKMSMFFLCARFFKNIKKTTLEKSGLEFNLAHPLMTTLFSMENQDFARL